ncbi:hypothetical protein TRVL_09661 [Trypanosoma vivax]|nr:hypothetical protein TRVL_09661 [Trypanosoma vivax]
MVGRNCASVRHYRWMNALARGPIARPCGRLADAQTQVEHSPGGSRTSWHNRETSKRQHEALVATTWKTRFRHTGMRKTRALHHVGALGRGNEGSSAFAIKNQR